MCKLEVYIYIVMEHLGSGHALVISDISGTL